MLLKWNETSMSRTGPRGSIGGLGTDRTSRGEFSPPRAIFMVTSACFSSAGSESFRPATRYFKWSLGRSVPRSSRALKYWTALSCSRMFLPSPVSLLPRYSPFALLRPSSFFSSRPLSRVPSMHRTLSFFLSFSLTTTAYHVIQHLTRPSFSKPFVRFLLLLFSFFFLFFSSFFLRNVPPSPFPAILYLNLPLFDFYLALLPPYRLFLFRAKNFATYDIANIKNARTPNYP